ncbi:VOC family protein [Sphingomonas kyeonggiensis]|uniref:Putative enzyme related to lactoylglutathione lyase n=1 Tax=Sphingomonas kyeonggiensis TaxID=1268553 RepID=A0A7W6JPP4_9SPHN|nr:VOC family protein [Sphingomonas kyeonggiensis]MBB4097272.1 putative enzyme related to lactoylglutathione lyase [Sphingomonas kyeonggiensis]
MSQPYIEHVNITVRSPERAAKLLGDLFDWHIRWEGPARDGGRTIHVGDERTYLAVYAPPEAPDQSTFEKGKPLNHVGILVDDLDEIERRVMKAGLIPFAHADYDPGRRFYFLDHDGTEFEIVSYA